GVEAAGRIGQGTFTVEVAGDDATSDVAVIGADDQSLGGIEQVDEGRPIEAPGEAVGSSAHFDVGDRVVVVPLGVPEGEGPELTVVGLVDEADLQVTPTLFTSWDDYEAVARAANPDAAEVLPNVIA